MSLRRAKSAREFYSTQTVFLTGSTGGLGGCLLYMLALVLRTLKIYILVRGSDKRAVDRWTQTMPEQWWDLVTSSSIEFVVGDMTDPMFGIGKDVLE
jgi:alcohol-forming fatty acyl-CoA reductase